MPSRLHFEGQRSPRFCRVVPRAEITGQTSFRQAMDVQCGNKATMVTDFGGQMIIEREDWGEIKDRERAKFCLPRLVASRHSCCTPKV